MCLKHICKQNTRSVLRYLFRLCLEGWLKLLLLIYARSFGWKLVFLFVLPSPRRSFLSYLVFSHSIYIGLGRVSIYLSSRSLGPFLPPSKMCLVQFVGPINLGSQPLLFACTFSNGEKRITGSLDALSFEITALLLLCVPSFPSVFHKRRRISASSFFHDGTVPLLFHFLVGKIPTVSPSPITPREFHSEFQTFERNFSLLASSVEQKWSIF